MGKDCWIDETDENPIYNHRIQPIVIQGIGAFTNRSQTSNSRFSLVQYPLCVDILIEDEDCDICINSLFISKPNFVNLVGKLDDGRSISASRLFAVNDHTFVPFESIRLGNEFEDIPKIVSFPLIGYYEGQFDIVDDEWHISTTQQDDITREARQLYRGWGIVAEGIELELENPSADLDSHIEKARQITGLLSFAAGTGITFKRYNVCWHNGEKLEVLRKGTGDEVGTGHCVPSFEMQRFIGSALPIIRSWTKVEQDIFRLTANYMNLSGTGYLDIQILSIWQAWEIVSLTWGRKTPLTAELKILKKAVLKACQDWRNSYPDMDPGGKWSNRLAFPFCWAMALEQMMSVIDMYAVDLEKINLDLAELKYARDKVVHTGKMPSELYHDRKHTIELLKASRLGLQILLLRMLKYDGMVDTEVNGWSAVKPIRGFLKS